MQKHFKILSLLFLLQFLSFHTFSQNQLIPFFSAGAIHHLGHGGANIEFGSEYELSKHIGVSANYRHSSLINQFNGKVEINAVAFNLSWIIVNRTHNRLSLSTGINAGNYYRLSINSASKYNSRHEKDYYTIWWNPAKIQYDYTFSNNLMVGAYIGLYGEDGDNSNLIGLVLGYQL